MLLVFCHTVLIRIPLKDSLPRKAPPERHNIDEARRGIVAAVVAIDGIRNSRPRTMEQLAFSPITGEKSAPTMGIDETCVARIGGYIQLPDSNHRFTGLKLRVEGNGHRTGYRIISAPSPSTRYATVPFFSHRRFARSGWKAAAQPRP